MTAEVFGGAVVKSISIENMLAQRDGILARVRQAIATLKEAESIAEASGISDAAKYRDFEYMLQGNDHYRRTELLNDGALEQITKRLDACAWNHLLHESGLRTLMDAKAREEWWQKIDKLEVPELTGDNIRATFGMLYETRSDIFDRGVINVFKSLSWDYKTNRPFRFGKRIVVEYLRNSVSGGDGLGWPNHRKCDQLDDLIRVLSVLDGKPEPDHRQGTYHLLYDDKKRFQRDVEHEYMQIRSFKNGNGHITFKRLDLVEKMNRIIAKHFPGALAHDHHTKEQP